MKSGLWAGKVLWITGASSGIGAAIAVEAARRGASVLLSGRNEAALAATAARCAAAGGEGCAPARTATLAFDLADRASRANAIARAPDLLGPVDVLILNAGVSQRAKFVDTSNDVIERLMETNFFAPVDLTRACLPSMVKAGQGAIVAVSSVAGLMGAPWRTGYSASKHALGGFLSSLRAELQGTGVGITVIYPGFVRTNISLNAFDGAGSPHGIMDPLQASGQDPAVTARHIADAVESGRPELKVAFDAKARLGVFLSRHAPGFFAKTISRHGGL